MKAEARSGAEPLAPEFVAASRPAQLAWILIRLGDERPIAGEAVP
jgi:hypothetical protein